VWCDPMSVIHFLVDFKDREDGNRSILRIPGYFSENPDGSLVANVTDINASFTRNPRNPMKKVPFSVDLPLLLKESRDLLRGEIKSRYGPTFQARDRNITPLFKIFLSSVPSFPPSHYTLDMKKVSDQVSDQELTEMIYRTYWCLYFHENVLHNPSKSSQKKINDLQKISIQRRLPFNDDNDCWAKVLTTLLLDFIKNKQHTKANQLVQKFPIFQKLLDPRNGDSQQLSTVRDYFYIPDPQYLVRASQNYIKRTFPHFCRLKPGECDEKITVFGKDTTETTIPEIVKALKEKKLSLDPGTSSYFFICHSTDYEKEDGTGWFLVWKNEVEKINKQKIISKTYQGIKSFILGKSSTYGKTRLPQETTRPNSSRQQQLKDALQRGSQKFDPGYTASSSWSQGQQQKQ